MRSKQLLNELLRFHDDNELRSFKSSHLMNGYDVTELKKDIDDIRKGFENFLKVSRLGDDAVDLIL